MASFPSLHHSGDRKFKMAISRRTFLKSLLGAGALTLGGYFLGTRFFRPVWEEDVFIGRAGSYQVDLAGLLLSGFRELGVGPTEIKGKKILLKPNLVETSLGISHINTHPLLVRGAVEAFLKLGAASVVVAEGTGHNHDTLLVLEESGLAEVLWEDTIPFVDLNYDCGYSKPNNGGFSRLKTLTLPGTLQQVDWIVSLAKLKTHHWAGVTLSLKNLFGLMPGMYYGWPKNILHLAGIQECILDIAATVKPHFAIVDGIVGMEGDGPIMGTPKPAGVLVMGRNLTAVDATCARIMGIDPFRVKYLAAAGTRLGPLATSSIKQRGEALDAVITNFHLVDKIPAHHGLRAL
jgi:uncharacterized protein (DUF362 family)